MSKTFDEYMESQRKEIDLFKWVKGEELGCDPGQDAIFEWIKKYASKFRHEYVLGKVNEVIQVLRNDSFSLRMIQRCLDLLEEIKELEES